MPSSSTAISTPPAGALRVNDDPSPTARVANRILEQIHERAVKLEPVRADRRQAGRRLDLEGNAAGVGLDSHCLGCRLDQRMWTHPSGPRIGCALARARVQLVDKFGHEGKLLFDAPKVLVAPLRFDQAVSQRCDKELDRGERRPQVVREFRQRLGRG